jgi:anti-sigma factor RsiW
MKCTEFIALTSEYVDGYLCGPEVAAFDAHLQRCAACARYLRVVEQGISLAREMDEIQPSEDFDWRLNRRLREIDDVMAERTRSVASGATLAVAIAGMVAFLAWSPILSPVVARNALSGGFGESRGMVPDDTAGGWEWWYGGGVEPAAMRPPSASNAFPGPYSPLRVDPPIRGGGESRTVLTSLIDTE